MSKRLFKLQARIGQSKILVQSEALEAVKAAVEAIIHHRLLLERYITRNPRFLHSLTPVKLEEDAPIIVRRMAENASIANVGPMACVAGALADLAVESMLRCGSRENIVENGGEVSIVCDETINVGIYAGQSILSHRIGFRICKDDCPIGIATSSATLSHAISFGSADAAIVTASTSTLADAAATAVCNAVAGEDEEGSIQRGLEVAEAIQGVRGALVIRGGYVGLTGKLPQLISIAADDEFKEASPSDFPLRKIL